MKTFFAHLSTTMAIFTICLLFSHIGMAQKKQTKEKESQEKSSNEEGTILLRIEKYENGQKKVYEQIYKDGKLSSSDFSQGYLFDTKDSVATLKLFGGGLGDTSFVIHPSGKMFFNLNDSTFSPNQFHFEHNIDSILHNHQSMVFNFNHSLMPNLDSLLSKTMNANTFMLNDMNKNFRFHLDTLLSKGFEFKWEDDFFNGDNLEMTLDKDKYDVDEVEVDGKKMLKIKPKESKNFNKEKDSKKRSHNMQPFDELLNLSTKPATGIVNLLFEVPADGITTITVSNAQGKEVYKEKVKTKAGLIRKNIDLNKEGPGVFNVSIKHNGKSTSKKITIQ